MLSAQHIYQLLILAILLVLLGITFVNLRTLPRIQNHALEDIEGEGSRIVTRNSPGAAVLVPARNEEVNIEACLRSLLDQDYARFEVWLYDDASTDATPQIAARIAAQHPQGQRLHILAGLGDPPPGWLGKAYACHRLYEALRAQSEPPYLLFTDADVRHEPQTLRLAVATAQETRAGLLSVFPRQLTFTLAERLAVPLLQHWAVYDILPLPLAFSTRTGPAFAAANGQFMLFTREAYEACGGHAGVRDKVLEDVELARAVKRAGHRVILADAGSSLITRMYRGLDEVWRGYSKNTYAFFGYSPLFLALAVVTLAALYVAPPVLALCALATGQLTWELFYLPTAQYAAAALARFSLAARFKTPLLDALLHPAAILFLIAILLNSLRWTHTGKGTWKGRASLQRQ